MPDYYSQMFSILGATGVIVPLGVPGFTWNGQSVGENADATTVTALHGGSGINAVFTYQPGGRLTWAKPTIYLPNRGRVPILPFNGSTEYLTTPDNDYWSMGDGTNDSARSYGAVANINDTATLRRVLRKGNSTGVTREWGGLQYDTSDKFGLSGTDQSANVSWTRIADAASPQGRQVSLAGTYDGTGGATAANGAALFIDGISVASTATNNASYVASENTTGLMAIGAAPDGAQYFDGSMYGAVCGPWYTQIQLTADQISRLTAIQREALKPSFNTALYRHRR